MPEHFGLDGSIARLAGKGFSGCKAGFAGVRHAAVEGNVLLREFHLISHAGGRGDIPGQRGIKACALSFHGLAKAFGVLVKTDEAHAEFVASAESGLHVAFQAELLPTADGDAQIALGIELRAFGDQIDGAPGLAATEQGRARSPEHFDGLDARHIARAAETAAGVETVDQKAAGQVDIAGKAAHGKAVPQAAKVVLASYRGGQIEGVIQVQRAHFAQQFAIDQLHRAGVFERIEIALISAALADDEDLFERLPRVALGQGRRDRKRQTGCRNQGAGRDGAVAYGHFVHVLS